MYFSHYNAAVVLFSLSHIHTLRFLVVCLHLIPLVHNTPYITLSRGNISFLVLLKWLFPNHDRSGVLPTEASSNSFSSIPCESRCVLRVSFVCNIYLTKKVKKFPIKFTKNRHQEIHKTKSAPGIIIIK